MYISTAEWCDSLMPKPELTEAELMNKWFEEVAGINTKPQLLFPK